MRQGAVHVGATVSRRKREKLIQGPCVWVRRVSVHLRLHLPRGKRKEISIFLAPIVRAEPLGLMILSTLSLYKRRIEMSLRHAISTASSRGHHPHTYKNRIHRKKKDVRKKTSAKTAKRTAKSSYPFRHVHHHRHPSASSHRWRAGLGGSCRPALRRLRRP